MKQRLLILVLVVFSLENFTIAREYPGIYISNREKQDLLERIENSKRAATFLTELEHHLEPYVERHKNNPEWIVSRLQMYWKFKYKKIWVKGMDFSHGEGEALVPTVRFSGSRDWATDYLRPALEDVKPYMDDERGLFLQNEKKEGQPWEWVHPSETGHIIERINEEIMELAAESAFLFWLTGEEKYSTFSKDIFLKYIEGMYYREAPNTTDGHHNQHLMGLQTFEVIHERIVEHLCVCYDFLHSKLKQEDANFEMIHTVFQRWADQEIKNGVPDNNWNLMQALYITYLALALENNEHYENQKGQEYYIDQVINQNSEKQKALKDVVKNYDQKTAVWPEVAGYNMLVANDMLEIFTLMDKSLNNNLVAEYPIIEKANLVIFQYLFPNGYTVSYGDAKHSRIRFNALEMLISQYRKYGEAVKEKMLTAQLKRFMAEGAYKREKIESLFQLFFYVEELADVEPAESFSDLVAPVFYAPNVSWIVQRNGNSLENGMMISKNASLGNHSHTNGVSIELYAKGMIFAPDCAAGISYWTEDHRDYYSRFAAHNTVVVDGISDYRNMRGSQAFEVNSVYPEPNVSTVLFGDYTLADVTFIEPSTEAVQQRVTGTIRTGKTSGYFIDIFRSARKDGKDKKHEYLFHGQGELGLYDFHDTPLLLAETDELSSAKGDVKGYDYFTEKYSVKHDKGFIARFDMPSLLSENLQVNLWMRGVEGREVFAVKAPYSRAIREGTGPEELYKKPLPTLVVRQNGEARTKPFVAVIDAFNKSEKKSVERVKYFQPEKENNGFVGIMVKSKQGRYDIIFNDEDPEAQNQFKHGRFKGSFGVMSKKENKFHSMLLNHGTWFEHGNMTIKTDKKGTVLIRHFENEFQIESSCPFIFTIPAKEFNFEKAVLVNTKTGKEFIAEVSTNGNMRRATFNLPALNQVNFLLK